METEDRCARFAELDRAIAEENRRERYLRETGRIKDLVREGLSGFDLIQGGKAKQPKQPEPGGPEAWHGTSGGYSNHYCRCEACREAWAARLRNYWKRRSAMRNTCGHERWGARGNREMCANCFKYRRRVHA